LNSCPALFASVSAAPPSKLSKRALLAFGVTTGTTPTGPVHLRYRRRRRPQVLVPSILGQMLSDKNSKKAKNVMQAMLGMVKIDIKGLKEAYDRE
jgi:hypothetical protein